LCQHSNCKRTDLLDPTDSVVRTTPVGSSRHPAKPIVGESTAFGDCAPATHPISDMHEAVSRNFTKSILQQAFVIAEIYRQLYEQLLCRKANALFKSRMHATTTTVHHPQGKKRKTELQAEPTNAGKTPVGFLGASRNPIRFGFTERTEFSDLRSVAVRCGAWRCFFLGNFRMFGGRKSFFTGYMYLLGEVPRCR
jgi:hypothetical protein